MINIVGIGANVYDTLITLPCYPDEDTKMRASEIKVSGGGPCATGLTAASKLGESTAFLGYLSDDAASRFLADDFEKYGVSREYIVSKPGYQAFTSYIWLSEKTVSRTCVFDKGNIPPLVLSEKQKQSIQKAKILMVDGNELNAAIEGAVLARKSGTKVLYDAGGLYRGIASLLPMADYLIPSQEFALGYTGAESAEEAAKKLFVQYHPHAVVITQGKEGGILFDGETVSIYPAFPVSAVDSNGAGDVFHGAFAFAAVRGMDYYKACVFSSAVSAIKCTRLGARQGVPAYEEVIQFLKERGYHEFEKNME